MQCMTPKTQINPHCRKSPSELATYESVWKHGTSKSKSHGWFLLYHVNVTYFLLIFSFRGHTAYAIFRQSIESQMCFPSQQHVFRSTSGQLISIHGKSSSVCDKVPKTLGKSFFWRRFWLNSFWVPHYIQGHAWSGAGIRWLHRRMPSFNMPEPTDWSRNLDSVSGVLTVDGLTPKIHVLNVPGISSTTVLNILSSGFPLTRLTKPRPFRKKKKNPNGGFLK